MSSNIYEVITAVKFLNQFCKDNLVFQPVPLN